MSRVLVAGSYNRDLSFAIDRVPQAGETRTGGVLLEGPGGKGSNQAIQAARCGARVTMLAALGNDAAGDEAVAIWRREGIDTRFVARKARLATGSAAILVEADGENRIVVASGANAALSTRDVPADAALWRTVRVVLAQLETPVAGTLAAFARARAAGAATILNTAPCTATLPDRVLRACDIAIANRLEAAALTGVDPRDGAALARALAARVRVASVVTLGAGGAVLARRDGTLLRRPAAKTKIRDTTGAGDAFAGAFAARLAAGADLAEALAWGVAAGGLACTKRGAAASYSTQRHIAALARRA
jgi:ribokinase